MASQRDYAEAIKKWLSDKSLDDFEGLTKLAKLYRSLSSLEKQIMAEGLADAIGEIHDAGVLGDAVHLAYHLGLFSESIVRAVDSRKDLGGQHRALREEIRNYEAYQAYQSFMTA